VPEGKVRVFLDPDYEPMNGASAAAPICTLEASSGDKSAFFDVICPRGYCAEIAKTPVAIDSKQYTRYTARFCHIGFVFILK